MMSKCCILLYFVCCDQVEKLFALWHCRTMGRWDSIDAETSMFYGLGVDVLVVTRFFKSLKPAEPSVMV